MNEYYVGDVFIVIEIAPDDNSSNIITNVVNVFSSQYAADQTAWDFNERAKKANLPQRWSVICRSLYE